VEADVALGARIVATIRHSAPTGSKRSAPADISRSGTARSAPDGTAQSYAVVVSQDRLKTFALAAAGNPAVPHAAPFDSTTGSTESATGATTAAAVTPVAIVAPDVVVRPGGTAAPVAIVAPPLDWNDSPFDVFIHLDLNVRAITLCPIDSDDDDGSSSSDDDSIFIDLSRD
jgi:hypothetical protein